MSERQFKQTEIGLIPDDWDFDELEKHSKIIMGQSPESVYYNSSGKGTLFLQGIRTFGSFFPTYDTWTTKITKLAKKDSVLLSVRAPVGEVNIANKDLCIGRGLLSIDGENNLFTFYLFKAFKEYVINKETGTVYGSVTRGDMAKLKFPFPKVNEQKSIAKVLYDLDSKIELNEQMNQTLEGIAQALFKRWFVDFDFPNEQGKPYKSSGGKMVWAEELQKEIPLGWEISILRKFVFLERGLSYKGAGLSDVGLPMINLGTVGAEHGFIYSGLKYYTGEFKERNLVKPGEIVIANTDITQNRIVLGSPSFVPLDLGGEKILFTHHIYALRNKSQLPNSYIYHLLQTKNYKNRVHGFAIGTTVLSLPEDAVLDFEFVVPNQGILKLFTKFTNALLEKFNGNIIENRILTQTRDFLLPKLMSGKIRVHNA